MDESHDFSCAYCAVGNCATLDKSFPAFCPTAKMSGDETDELLAKYLKNPQDRNIATVAALVESDYYCTATRAEEILIFAKRMGYKKVGVATCYGLLSECSQFTCYE